MTSKEMYQELLKMKNGMLDIDPTLVTATTTILMGIWSTNVFILKALEDISNQLSRSNDPIIFTMLQHLEDINNKLSAPKGDPT